MEDTYNLQRFIDEQMRDYSTAYAEIISKTERIKQIIGGTQNA